MAPSYENATIRQRCRLTMRVALSALLALFLSSSVVWAGETVTNNLDSGDGSLRKALTDVAASDTIDFNITSNTIEPASYFSISKNNITIDGKNNGELVILDGGSVGPPLNYSLFDLSSSVNTLTLKDITFQNVGTADDGSVRSGSVFGAKSVLTLNLNGDVTFRDNVTRQVGGALYFEKATTINATDGRVGFYRNSAPGSTGSGGAIYAAGDLTINTNNATITFSNNTAPITGWGGGAIRMNGANTSLTLGQGISFGIAGNASSGNSTGGMGGAILYSKTDASTNATTGEVGFYYNSALKGGALAHFGSHTLNGSFRFIGNSAVGTDAAGGAVYAYGSLSMNTGATGDILFSGNTVNGVSNSLAMGGDGTLTLSGDKSIIFDDPFAREKNTIDYNLTSSAALVQLAGDSTLSGTGGGGAAAVTGGEFRILDGASFATGGTAGSAFFTLDSGATLSGAGTISSPGTITLKGDVSPGKKRYTAHATDLTEAGTTSGDAIGVLTLDGNVALDGATLNIDTAAGNKADKTTITGGVDFASGSKNTVNVTAFRKGEYVIMDWNGTETGTIADNFNDVTGFTPNSRQSASLTLNAADNELILTMAVENKTLTWTGTTDGAWVDGAETKKNWNDDESNATFFVNGDTVIFDSTGSTTRSTVAIDAAGVVVDDMTVSEGGYSFTNGKITGNQLTLNASGTPTTTFKNDIDFDDGIIIATNNTLAFENASAITNDNDISGTTSTSGGMVKQQGAGKLTLTGTIADAIAIEVNTGSVLELEKAGAYAFNNTLTGGGTLVLDLGSATNALTLGSTVGNAFTGTVELEKGTLDITTAVATALGSSILKLDADATAIVSTGRTINAITFNGGTLDIQAFTGTGTIAPTVVNVATLDTTNGGTVKIDLETLNNIKTSASDYKTFYDCYDIPANYQKQLVAATTVTGDGTLLALEDKDGNNLATAQAETRKIMDGTNHTGNATFDYIAGVNTTAPDKGIYLGYGLKEIEALSGKIVVLDSSGSTSGTPTINAKLTGSGGFTFSGSKAASVGNAASSYTGATVVDTLTVTMTTDNAFGATSSLELKNNGKVDMNDKSQTVGELKGEAGTGIDLGDAATDGLTVNQASNSNFAGILSGAGGTLTKNGAGNLTLSGDNTYTGNTTIGAGTLTIAGSLGVGDDYVGAIANSGSLVFETAVDQKLSGILSGTGSLTQSGANTTLTLSAANTYTGDTAIAEGTLALGAGGSIADSNLIISAAGTFDISTAGGNVVTAGLEVEKGSTLSAGIHTLDLSGKPVVFDLADADKGDTILNVTDGKLKITADPDSVTLLNVSQALKKDDSITLATNLTADSSATDDEWRVGRKRVTLSLDGDTLYAIISGISSFVEATDDYLAAAAPGNANIQSGGSYLDWLLTQPYADTDGMESLEEYFFAITEGLSPNVGARELERWFGAYAAYANQALASDAERFRARWRAQNHSFLNSFVFRDLLPDAANAGVASDSGLASAIYSPRCVVPAGQSRIWAGGFGTWADQDRRNDLSGYKYDSRGLALGYEYTRDCLNFGFAAAYSKGDLKVNDLAYKNEADILNLALYAAYAHESGFYAEGGLGYGHAWNDYKVNMTLGGAKAAKYGSDIFSADLELGYIARLPRAFNVIPSVGIRYDHTRNGSWAERLSGNTDPNLTPNRFANASDNALAVPVGVRANKVFRFGCDGMIIPEVRASYVYQAVRAESSIASSFAGAPGGMKMRGVDSSRSHWRFGAGVSGRFNSRVDFRVDYDYETRSGYKGHNVNASVGVSF